MAAINLPRSHSEIAEMGIPIKPAPCTEYLAQGSERKFALPADVLQAMAQADRERGQFALPAVDPNVLRAIDLKATEEARKQIGRASCRERV